MNNLQKIASLISGYEPHESWSSAKDDGYYDKKTEDEKIAYIIQLSNTAEEVEVVSILEAYEIYNFLEKPQGENERYYAWIQLLVA